MTTITVLKGLRCKECNAEMPFEEFKKHRETTGHSLFQGVFEDKDISKTED